jgi:hypothetical protein
MAICSQIAPFKYLDLELHEIVPTLSPSLRVRLTPVSQSDELFFTFWTIDMQKCNTHYKRRKFLENNIQKDSQFVMLINVTYPSQQGKFNVKRASALEVIKKRQSFALYYSFCRVWSLDSPWSTF